MKLGICDARIKTPGLHSFSYLHTDSDGNKVFYSCPGRASYTEYNDGLDKLMNHINQSLEGVNSWIWIFDGADFGLRNAMHLKTAMALCKLMNSDSRLKRIDIVNPTWHIHSTMLFLYPIMSQDMRDKVKMDNKL
jgi:hypothetical protein